MTMHAMSDGIRNPGGIDAAGNAVEPTPATVEVDQYGPWLVTIDQPHHQLHEGERFVSTHAAATVNTNGTCIVHIKTGANYSHLVYDVFGTNVYTIQFYEAPTVTGNGTSVAVLNRNRNSAKVTTTTMLHTPTTTALGTSLEGPLYIGSGQSKVGGTTRGQNEWLLKPNTSYLVHVTSRGDANSLTVFADWYDEGAVKP